MDTTQDLPIDEQLREEAGEEPAFIVPAENVEVAEDALKSAPIDDDDDMEEEEEKIDQGNDGEANSAVDIVEDMSIFRLEKVHTDSLFSVDAIPITLGAEKALAIASGGGDDRAYLTFVSSSDQSSKVMRCAHDHTDSVSCVSFNRSGEVSDSSGLMLAVGSFDGTVQLYDVQKAAVDAMNNVDIVSKGRQLDGPSDIEWIAWHPKGGTVLLAGSSDATVWMWFATNGKCLQVFVGHEGEVTDGCFTKDGKFAVTISTDMTMRIWAPKTGLSRHVFRNQGGNRFAEAPLLCLDLGGGTDGQLAIVGAEDGTAWIVHLANKKILTCLSHCSEGDLRSVEAVGFAPNSVNVNWCATAGVDGTLKIWDLTNNQCRQVCKHNKSAVTRIRWHKNLPLVYSAASDGVIRVWDARNGALVKHLTGHNEVINDMRVVPNSEGEQDIIVSGSDDHSLKVFTVS